MDLGEAVKLMFHMRIKKLPVFDRKRLVGLVSLTDIAPFSTSSYLNIETTCRQTSCTEKHEENH